MRASSRDRALRAAIVVSGLSAIACASGCARVRARVVEGTGFNGELCVGWSLAGSAESCCAAQNAYSGYADVAWDPVAQVCTAVTVMGPFVPPAFDA